MVFITTQYIKGRENCNVSLTQTIQFLTGTLPSKAKEIISVCIKVFQDTKLRLKNL